MEKTERKDVVTRDDVINIRILLNTTKSVDEFLKKLN